MRITQPRMYGLGGRGMWKPPTRKAFEPSGLTLGATVRGMGRKHGPWEPRAHVEGQVWCQAEARLWGRDMWWVVDNAGTAWCVHGASALVVGQCDDAALFGEGAA